MRRYKRAFHAFPVVCGLLVSPSDALPFGAEGHRVAGRVAQTRLCERALSEIVALGGGVDLARLGPWADRIRSDDRWAHTAPWHYMNVADDEPLERYRSPREGDILWAIARFSAALGDASLANERRLDALRFLTHFVVDLHQPLHVGRASDRGGNLITVTLPGGEDSSLHDFWDSAALRLAGLSEQAYLQSVLAVAGAERGEWSRGTPLDWARESQALRSRVYALVDPLSHAYIDEAVRLTRRRLAQAGVRLALQLNRVFCAGQPRGRD